MSSPSFVAIKSLLQRVENNLNPLLFRSPTMILAGQRSGKSVLLTELVRNTVRREGSSQGFFNRCVIPVYSGLTAFAGADPCYVRLSKELPEITIELIGVEGLLDLERRNEIDADHTLVIFDEFCWTTTSKPMAGSRQTFEVMRGLYNLSQIFPSILAISSLDGGWASLLRIPQFESGLDFRYDIPLEWRRRVLEQFLPKWDIHIYPTWELNPQFHAQEEQLPSHQWLRDFGCLTMPNSN